MKSIVVDGVKYVEESAESEFNIVVIASRFVYVGFTEIKDNFLIIKKSKCIRIWGTDDIGLHFLSRGPLKQTVLDESGDFTILMHSVISIIPADKVSWGF